MVVTVKLMKRVTACTDYVLDSQIKNFLSSEAACGLFHFINCIILLEGMNSRIPLLQIRIDANFSMHGICRFIC
jgi:hypothetical protein